MIWVSDIGVPKGDIRILDYSFLLSVLGFIVWGVRVSRARKERGFLVEKCKLLRGYYVRS